MEDVKHCDLVQQTQGDKVAMVEMVEMVLATTISSGSPNPCSMRGSSMEEQCQPIERATPEMLSYKQYVS